MKTIIEKYGKKKVYIGLVTALVVSCVAGIGGTVAYANNKKQAILDSIYIKFIESPTIEYGNETVDYQSFILKSVGEVTLPSESINTKEVGSKELVYKVSKEGYEKEQKVMVEVKDTQAPIITFKEETVTIEIGEELDLKSNVESILDPVDGAIEEYEVIHNLDNNAAGEYTVTIKATDKNNNISEKNYVVVVKEKEIVESTTQGNTNYNAGYAQQRPSTNTSKPSYNGGTGSQPSNNGNSNMCVGYSPMTPIGNSGRIFNTREEANAYGFEQIDNPNSPYYDKFFMAATVNNGCDQQVGWTVSFF